MSATLSRPCDGARAPTLSPVRWWRDEATRFASRVVRTVPDVGAAASTWFAMCSIEAPDPIADVLAFVKAVRR